MLKHGTLAKIASLSILTVFLGTQSAEAFRIISFNGKATRWKEGKTLQIEYDPNFGSGFNSSGCDRETSCSATRTIDYAIKQSINSWKNVGKTDLRADTPKSKTISSTPKYDGRNQIKFYGSGWQSLPFSPPPAALAVTISTYSESGEILDADIFINGENFSWGILESNGSSDAHDLQNVITHEMGHFLGLDHTSNNPSESDEERYKATMYYASFSGETFRRTLDTLDVYGIQHLYTDANIGEPTVDGISPNNIQITFKQSATFEIEGDGFLPITSVVLARNSDDGDVVGRINSVSNNKINVTFDVSNMLSGEYDLVVANSYNKYTRMETALAIDNQTVMGTYTGEQTSGGGCSSNGSSPILLILLTIFFLIPRKYRFV